jgi:hypothetical protein
MANRLIPPRLTNVCLQYVFIVDKGPLAFCLAVEVCMNRINYLFISTRASCRDVLVFDVEIERLAEEVLVKSCVRYFVNKRKSHLSMRDLSQATYQTMKVVKALDIGHIPPTKPFRDSDSALIEP